MGIPSTPVPSFVPTTGLQSGTDLQKMASQLYDTASGIVAQADTTKANATRLNAVHNLVATVAGAADSVLLPPGYVGLEITIVNDGAESMQVFGSGSDTINDVATGTGVAQAAGIMALYRCYAYNPTTKVARWFRLLSA